MKCLRNTLVQLGEPPAEAPVGRDQVTLLALHAAFQLVEPAMRIYQENKAEVCGGRRLVWVLGKEALWVDVDSCVGGG